LTSTVIFLREVAVGDRGGDFRDVSDLVGQVARQHVDVVCEVLPGARHASHLRLAAELAVGADFLGDACHLVGERTKLIDHAVDGRADSQEFALDRLAVDLQRHLLAQVAFRNCADDAGDLAGRLNQSSDERVDGVEHHRPSADRARHHRALCHPAFAAHRLLDPDNLARYNFLAFNGLVKRPSELVEDGVAGADGQANRKIAVTRRDHRIEQFSQPTIRVRFGFSRA
jgi:hypothetical protein